MSEAVRIKNLSENRTNEFSTWAERLIVEYKDEGKDIGPMLKELKNYKNS